MMITLFGRYRWIRLHVPLRLKISNETFQRKLDEVLRSLNDVFSVVDDIIIDGCGNTNEKKSEKGSRSQIETSTGKM
jgi:hypothetical protein